MQSRPFVSDHDQVAAVLTLSGDVDQRDVDTLAALVRRLPTGSTVDLSAVSYLPSAAVGILVTAQHRAAGGLRLVASGGSVAGVVLTVMAVPHDPVH